MRFARHILAMLAVAGLLIAPATVVLANGIFMPDIGQLTITPPNAAVGEKVTISVVAANDSIDTAGTLPVILKINGVEAARQEVFIEAQDQVPVTFTVSRDVPGTYHISIGDLVTDYVEGSLIVGGGSAPPTTAAPGDGAPPGAVTSPTAGQEAGAPSGVIPPATTEASTSLCSRCHLEAHAAASPVATSPTATVPGIKAAGVGGGRDWLVIAGQAVGVLVPIGIVDYVIRRRRQAGA